MKARIRIGATVQISSTVVLWLKRAGSGLAFLLKRTTTTIRSPATRRVMRVMIGSRM